MSFLTPLFLLGALAVGGPIIYHLIRRSTRERTVFSSLMFLLPTPPRLTKKSRLEDILLLILRCFALGLFAFAFARPFIRTSDIAPAAPAVGKKVVVLLDTSASMRRTGMWSDAQDRAMDAVREATPIDDVAIFTFDRQPRTLLSFEEWKATPVDQRVALASSRVDSLTPSWKATQLGNALIAAAEALEDEEANRDAPGPREIVLVSDLQSGSQLGTLQAFEWPKELQLTLSTVRPRSTANAGLQLVPDAPEPDPEAAPATRVRVTNAANSTRFDFQVGWSRDGAASSIVGDPISINVPPGQSRVVRVPTPENSGDLTQIVLLGDDDTFDNVVHAVPPERREVKVFYFGGEEAGDPEQPLFWLSRATESLGDSRGSVTLLARKSGDTIAAEDIQDAKLFFATDSVDPGVAETLRTQMVDAGKTVVLSPRSAAGGALMSVLLGGQSVDLTEGVTPGSTSAIRAGATPPYAMLGEIDYQNPLFSLFADPRYGDFSKIHFWKHRALSVDGIPGARVVARFDNRDPALVEIPVGRGRLICLLSGWDRADSDLAQSTRFVLLIASILDVSGGLSDQSEQFVVGDPLPVVAIAGTSAAMTITPPGGQPVALPAGSNGFTATDLPGIYRVTAGARTFRVGINLDSAESRTAPLPADELEQYGAPGSAAVVNAAHEARREALLQGSDAESRQKLWRWFIGLALVVLLLESLLAGWTARRHATSVSTGGLTS